MQSGNEIWPVYAILQNNFFIKKFYEKCGLVKISFPNRSYASFFANIKEPGTSFQAAVFVKFFDEIFSFVI